MEISYLSDNAGAEVKRPEIMAIDLECYTSWCNFMT